MVFLPKPDVILTHESDLDGLVAGVLLRLARTLFDTDVRLEAWHYHGLRQRPFNESSAWVADLPFEPRMDRTGWVVIDHHAARPSQTRATDPRSYQIHRRLCYEQACRHELGSPALDRLVHLNDVADLFLEEGPDFIPGQ